MRGVREALCGSPAACEYEFVYIGAPDGGLWMRDPPNGKGQPTTDPNWASDSLNLIRSTIDASFVGIVGFSQGAAFVPVVLSAITDPPFEWAIMFAGYLPETHKGLMQTINDARPIAMSRALVWMGARDFSSPTRCRAP